MTSLDFVLSIVIILLKTPTNRLDSSPEVTDFLRLLQRVVPVSVPIGKDVPVPGLLEGFEGKH